MNVRNAIWQRSCSFFSGPARCNPFGQIVHYMCLPGRHHYSSNLSHCSGCETGLPLPGLSSVVLLTQEGERARVRASFRAMFFAAPAL
jgi:hypothetical protein